MVLNQPLAIRTIIALAVFQPITVFNDFFQQMVSKSVFRLSLFSSNQVSGALLRGCTTSLLSLNLSGNTFSVRKATKEIIVPPSWEQFFSSALYLNQIKLQNCKLPQEALKWVFHRFWFYTPQGHLEGHPGHLVGWSPNPRKKILPSVEFSQRTPTLLIRLYQ